VRAALNTRVYTPITGPTETITLARYVHGRKYLITGAWGRS
jgi:hypothetical protein